MSSKESGAERLRKSIERKKEISRETSRRYRAKSSGQSLTNEVTCPESPTQLSPFISRTTKKRAVDAVREKLPKTPEKRAAVVSSLINSPGTRKILEESCVVLSAEEQNQYKLFRAVVDDVTSMLAKEKSRRNDNSRAAVSTGIAMLCGENVKASGLKSAASATFGINRRRIAMSMQRRATALANRESAWMYTHRKTRSDALSEDVRKLAFEFWASPGNSRPTGNKTDVKRKRLGPNEYIEHEKQILEKTQTEIFQDFKKKYPEIGIKQRAFESCKPFFVVPARPEDRNSCCCRQHVEIRMLFKTCMDYRRSIFAKDEERSRLFKVYDSLNELVDETLCENPGNEFHKSECLHRSCENCGTRKFQLLPEESTRTNSFATVKWQKFDYVETGEKRRLQLIEMQTSPGEMFDYFTKLLETFPAHRFRARWQHDQLQSLLDNLPLGHICCIHDYFENYTCQHQDQIQSLYYGQTQASIHVTVLHRHALLYLDGEESSENDPRIVTEHLFTISPDLRHDNHSVQGCRTNVVNYVNDIGYEVQVMHEWTDGCSAQYKSRHCMGDVSFSLLDFGVPTVRNYFETSHAKGPQDGAGANLKHKADMAVIRRETIIQNAKDLFEFAKARLSLPSSTRFQSQVVKLKRRVFFFVPEHDRERPYRMFREVKNNRTIHSILANGPERNLKIRKLSCYCEKCLQCKYDECTNTAYVQLECERVERRATRADMNEQRERIVDLISTNSTVATASGDVDEDYYLLKVSGNGPEVLSKSTRDDWGAKYIAGVEVLRGHFYVKEAVGQHVYRLVTDKVAVVYAATARFICSDLERIETAQGNELFSLPEHQHLDILEALNGF